MNDDQFSALLAAVIPGVVALISTKDRISEQDATEAFFSSETYARLSDEKLKLWHFSPETLYAIFHGERMTGKMLIPEEAG